MEEIIEFIVDVIYHLSFVDFKSSNHHSEKKVQKIIANSDQETYMIGLIATMITIYFEDDEKIDRAERKLIMKTLNKIPFQLPKETKKDIKNLLKNKMTLEELKLLYIRRDIDYKKIYKILDELESILGKSSKDININKKLHLIYTLRKDYLKDIS